MNYTEKQINLAGVIQPEGGPRNFDAVQDLQGEGARVLSQYANQVIAEEGDCCVDLAVCDSERTALQQENSALSGENEELQDEVTQNAQVGGAGGTAVGIAETHEGVFGEITVSLTCTRIEAFGASRPDSFTKYFWSCVWSTNPDPNIPQAIAGATEMRVVWIKSTGEEKYGSFLISGSLDNFEGVTPWAINSTQKPNSGSCQFATRISPFSSDSTATVFNTVRFDVKAQTTYSPESAWTPVLFRELGKGSQTNGTTIDPDA